MATLAAIRHQIAALEAKAERITKVEMAGAIEKVRKIMSDFGLTVEHLTSTGAPRGKRGAARKGAAASPHAGAKPPKYADPKSGKTWSGFGRVPAWIAGAKNRESFLIGKPKADSVVEVAPSKERGGKALSKTKAASPSKARKAPLRKVVAGKSATLSTGGTRGPKQTASKKPSRKASKPTTKASTARKPVRGVRRKVAVAAAAPSDAGSAAAGAE